MENEQVDLLKKIKEDTIKRIESKKSGKELTENELIEINSAILTMVEMLEEQDAEIERLKSGLRLKAERESEFDDYQLDILDFIFANGSINEAELKNFTMKDSKYRVAFTKLKDVYIYKGFGTIYSDAVKYHIKPEKEKYVAEQLGSR